VRCVGAAAAARDTLVAVPHALFAACVLHAVLSRGQAQVYTAGSAVAGALIWG
jgi:hypothetical protein